ncbi:DUF5590 domain-containing protein [Paenibacillus alkaliterrae]|uniref:cell wall elongation regulator TseB-like domain-containing protein n=1 Tax=Paenibacillus alkaliterrae TaxID=320909 RepID=UPI001F2B0041|nr:DUF5590 domain-containing protein [Paenibacillus alkaliterrae]MCF2937650.1 DUF5590 domain-containing protein [Paenibacillus alkaliterrae]
MTPHRWIFLIAAGILLSATGFGVYFREIQMPRWTAASDAEAKAIEAAGLENVDNVYNHVWHKESWIVEGSDLDGNKVFVWLTGDNESHAVKAEYGVSFKQIKNTFLVEKPDAAIKRIQPGMFDGKPVWEVFYSIGQSPERYYYEFYMFDSGTFIDMYQLPAKTEP